MHVFKEFQDVVSCVVLWEKKPASRQDDFNSQSGKEMHCEADG